MSGLLTTCKRVHMTHFYKNTPQQHPDLVKISGRKEKFEFWARPPNGSNVHSSLRTAASKFCCEKP